MDSNCDQKEVYEGEVCLNELAKWQQCFSPGPEPNIIYLPSDINQEEAEGTATGLVDSLGPLLLSPECETAIRSFLCLYLFGSCDSDNQQHRGTQENCESLRDGACASEFIRAQGLCLLPNCNDLQYEKECQGSYNQWVAN